MRWIHPDGSTIHLAYCTNVHPAEDLDGILEQLRRFASPIRSAMSTDRLGVGLWLARDAASPLAQDPVARKGFRGELDRLGLEVVTLNGFPYRAFHAPVVKLAVYEPDWSDPARAEYTLDLATILADLLPDDVSEGSISTLPLAWREGWNDVRAKRSRAQLERVAESLAVLAERTDRTIRVGLEPEPGCIVETTAQALEALDGLTSEHLGICLDTCHLAVQFEDPGESVRAAEVSGVPVVKAQLASALRVPDPAAPGVREALEAFAEPRFLHQTRVSSGNRVSGVDDLPAALEGGLSADGEWRIHFHTAIHAAGEPPLATTSSVLSEALRALVGGSHPSTRHLEVETYTWTVLPPERRPADDRALVDGLASELGWVRRELEALGLKELP